MVSFMEEWQYVAIFILAAIPWIELAVVIPLGILYGLAPVPVSVISFIGNLLPVLLIVLAFDYWQKRRAAKRKREGREDGHHEDHFGDHSSWRKQRASRIWNQYGLVGLALTAPIFVGVHIATVIALSFKSSKTKVSLWMTISLAVWTLVLGIGSYYGLDALGWIL